jgi:hypothetical protein
VRSADAGPVRAGDKERPAGGGPCGGPCGGPVRWPWRSAAGGDVETEGRPLASVPSRGRAKDSLNDDSCERGRGAWVDAWALGKGAVWAVWAVWALSRGCFEETSRLPSEPPESERRSMDLLRWSRSWLSCQARGEAERTFKRSPLGVHRGPYWGGAWGVQIGGASGGHRGWVVEGFRVGVHGGRWGVGWHGGLPQGVRGLWRGGTRLFKRVEDLALGDMVRIERRHPVDAARTHHFM